MLTIARFAGLAQIVRHGGAPRCSARRANLILPEIVRVIEARLPLVYDLVRRAPASCLIRLRYGAWTIFGAADKSQTQGAAGMPIRDSADVGCTPMQLADDPLMEFSFGILPPVER